MRKKSERKKSARRFVEDEDSGTSNEFPRDADPAPFSTTDTSLTTRIARPDQRVGDVEQTELAEDLKDALAVGQSMISSWREVAEGERWDALLPLLRDLAELQLGSKLYRLPHRARLGQHVILVDIPDPDLVLSAQCRSRRNDQLDASTPEARLPNSSEEVDERTLPRSGRTEDAAEASSFECRGEGGEDETAVIDGCAFPVACRSAGWEEGVAGRGREGVGEVVPADTNGGRWRIVLVGVRQRSGGNGRTESHVVRLRELTSLALSRETDDQKDKDCREKSSQDRQTGDDTG